MPVQPPTDDDSSGRSEDEQAVPEEEWDHFLDDSYGRIRAEAPKEPSARARQVARRLREQDELAARRKERRRRLPFGRSGRQQPRSGEPKNWRTGPAWREMNGGSSRASERWRTVIVLLVVAAVALLVLNPSAALSLFRRVSAHSPAPTAPATSAPSPGAESVPTTARPFAGSPAEKWANGADGITVPAARAVGSMTRAQVADTLRLTKRYLIATDLDPGTLRGGRPSTALGLIDPLDTGELDRITRDLGHPDAAHDPLSYLTRYDPAQLRPVGTVIKVKGTMTFAAGERGSVEVRADYTFVYPFTKVGAPQDGISRVITRQSTVTRMYPAGRVEATPGRLWLADVNSDQFNSACGIHDGFVHPQFEMSAPTGSPATGPTEDPYDLKTPLSRLPKTCGVDSRT